MYNILDAFKMDLGYNFVTYFPIWCYKQSQKEPSLKRIIVCL